jgi:hypothetical protein
MDPKDLPDATEAEDLRAEPLTEQHQKESSNARAQFLVERCAHLQTANASFRRAKLDVARGLNVGGGSSSNSSVRRLSVPPALPLADDLSSSSSISDENENENDPAPPTVSSVHHSDPSVSELRATLASVYESLLSVQHNARLKEQQLELQVMYYQKSMQDSKALNQKLIHMNQSLYRIVNYKCQDNKELTDVRNRELQTEKHLNQLLMARKQMSDDNFALKKLLLSTLCQECRDKLPIGRRNNNTEGGGSNTGDETLHVRSMHARPIGATADSVKAASLRTTNSPGSSLHRRVSQHEHSSSTNNSRSPMRTSSSAADARSPKMIKSDQVVTDKPRRIARANSLHSDRRPPVTPPPTSKRQPSAPFTRTNPMNNNETSPMTAVQPSKPLGILKTTRATKYSNSDLHSTANNQSAENFQQSGTTSNSTINSVSKLQPHIYIATTSSSTISSGSQLQQHSNLGTMSNSTISSVSQQQQRQHSNPQSASQNKSTAFRTTTRMETTTTTQQEELPSSLLQSSCGSADSSICSQASFHFSNNNSSLGTAATQLPHVIVEHQNDESISLVHLETIHDLRRLPSSTTAAEKKKSWRDRLVRRSISSDGLPTRAQRHKSLTSTTSGNSGDGRRRNKSFTTKLLGKKGDEGPDPSRSSRTTDVEI